VIKVPERAESEEYADVTAACRELADEYGLRVVVEGDHNSIPPNLLTTKRERLMEVEPMSRDVLENISSFSGLIKFLKENGLADGVWDVLGGSPADYNQLDSVYEQASPSPPNVINAVKRFVFDNLSDALTKQILKSSPNTKLIINQFRTKGVSRIPVAELKALGLVVDNPNKVFRVVRQDKGVYVIPATPAVGLIITKGIKNDSDLESLCADLFKSS
jgi:hypothetical protein